MLVKSTQNAEYIRPCTRLRGLACYARTSSEVPLLRVFVVQGQFQVGSFPYKSLIRGLYKPDTVYKRLI